MNTTMKTILITTALGFVATTSVSAQGTGGGLVGTYCKAEIAKYCANVKHGTGAIPACLAKHKAKLSNSCKNALARKGPGGGLGQGQGQGARWR
jgi:hypothetical protein